MKEKFQKWQSKGGDSIIKQPIEEKVLGVKD